MDALEKRWLLCLWWFEELTHRNVGNRGIHGNHGHFWAHEAMALTKPRGFRSRLAVKTIFCRCSMIFVPLLQKLENLKIETWILEAIFRMVFWVAIIVFCHERGCVWLAMKRDGHQKMEKKRDIFDIIALMFHFQMITWSQPCQGFPEIKLVDGFGRGSAWDFGAWLYCYRYTQVSSQWVSQGITRLDTTWEMKSCAKPQATVRDVSNSIQIIHHCGKRKGLYHPFLTCLYHL